MSRIRLLFAAIILFLLVGAGTAWILTKVSLIPNAWTPLLETTTTVLAAVEGAVIGFFQLRPSDTKTLDPAIAAQKLFYALKRRRDEDGRSFNLDTLPTIIPLTLRDYEDPPDSAGISITDMYMKSHDLLILGKPGSGKTTLLQQLTLYLMDKELKESEITEEARSLPIFLYLPDWAREKKPFKVWFTQQLLDIKLKGNGLKSSFINYWMSNGNFVLLLDGLDEMSEEDSKKCIDAINKFRTETGTHCPFVISCRLDRYQILRGGQHSLNIGQKEAVVQNLKPSRAQDYLNQAGAKKLSRFYQEEQSRHLREIADTPNMLAILAQTYPDASLNWKPPVNLSEKELMKTYVNNAIEAKRNLYSMKDMPYWENMPYWLTRLANHMDGRPVFYFRPDNLPNKTAKSLYVSSTWLIILLLGGAACWLVALGKFPLWQLLPMIALIAGLYGYLQLLPMIGLIAGLYGYLLKSIATGLGMTVLYILTLTFPFFSLASSKKKTLLQRLWEVLTTQVIILLPVILLTAVLLIWARAIGIPIWLGILVVWLIEGLLWYTLYRLKTLQRLLKSGEKSTVLLYTWLEVVYLMIVRLVEPLSPDKLSPKTSTLPSLKKGMSIGIASGLIILLSGFFIWQTNLLLAAILIGISVWLDRGLGASIRGYILRFWFWRYKILPWNAGFLDDAVTIRLLVEQGDGYRFFRGTDLQNYFREQSRD